MSQLLKKYALLAACAVLALCFATRPAHAQMVSTDARGDHLLFGYWSTADGTDTQVAVHTPLGVRDSGEIGNVVRLLIRDTMGDLLAHFKVCLTPGDSWTATLSMMDGMSSLMVGDEGKCDADTQPPGATRVTPAPIDTPMKGAAVSLGTAMSGYLEAIVAPNDGLLDGTTPCAGPTAVANNPGGICGASGVDAQGGDDDDNAPDDTTPRDITGTAALVNPMSGFSSNYLAVALDGCVDDEAADATSGFRADDSDGCWTTGAADSRVTDGTSLMGVLAKGQDLLTGRWTAIDDDNVMSHTKLIVTFPVQHLNHTTTNVHEETVNGTDPLSIYVFDENGGIALKDHSVMLDRNVNTCMFGRDMDHDGHEHGDEMPRLSCNGDNIGEIDGMAGEFRLFNNNADIVDANGMLNDYDSATDGKQTDDGTEADDYSTANDTDSATTGNQPGGQKAAEGLAAIALNCSYFMGTDGLNYDMASMGQWIDLGGDETDHTTVHADSTNNAQNGFDAQDDVL
jgi:hypothetical protein